MSPVELCRKHARDFSLAAAAARLKALKQSSFRRNQALVRDVYNSLPFQCLGATLIFLVTAPGGAASNSLRTHARCSPLPWTGSGQGLSRLCCTAAHSSIPSRTSLGMEEGSSLLACRLTRGPLAPAGNPRPPAPAPRQNFLVNAAQAQLNRPLSDGSGGAMVAQVAAPVRERVPCGAAGGRVR
jgi:hypothetical protein